MVHPEPKFVPVTVRAVPVSAIVDGDAAVRVGAAAITVMVVPVEEIELHVT